ncbi:MAG: helix-turn-helix domain-containing protein [Butyrivibrio sp.]|nr:helix-turn-helix domain-containing protein [Butyrivibrio sp.]
MPRSKHSPEFRARVSQEYMDGTGSVRFLANKYGIGYSTLLGWINEYRIHGISVFCHKKNKTYSKELKIKFSYCISHNRDYKNTAARYDVSYSQVYSWVKKYDADGEDGLADRRGHSKTDDEVDELERLRRENLRLKRQLEEKDMVVKLLKK